VVQARTVLYLLARRYPAVRAMGSPTYRQNLTLRSLDSLEVALR
jgi:hypothetical protein